VYTTPDFPGLTGIKDPTTAPITNSASNRGHRRRIVRL
jgi:hypothetical protein